MAVYRVSDAKASDLGLGLLKGFESLKEAGKV